MAKRMQLQVITPDRVILETEVDAIRVQLADGWWGILPGHAPFLAHVVAGIMRYRRQEASRYVILYQGTIEVRRQPGKPNSVLVLTAAAEEGDDLAVLAKALEQQIVRTKQMTQEAHIKFTRARLALEHALRETAEQNLLGPRLA